MNIIKKLEKEIRKEKFISRIVFPEGEDEKILKSAILAQNRKITHPILLGDKTKIQDRAKRLKVSLEGIEIVNPAQSSKLEEYSKKYSKKQDIPMEISRKILLSPLYFGAMATKTGEADGLIGGAVFTSGEVIAISQQVIGLEKGISVPSSFFLMNIPQFDGGEEGYLIFSDASVNINPCSKELADIAFASAKSARDFFGWKPRVALLSFSTKGSASHALVDKVIKATQIAKKKKFPGFVDGEFQVDAALNREVAERKIEGKLGQVAGKANVLVFPDLNASNCGYKLVKIIAQAHTYGPILQGFAKPVSDLSRGAKIEDIFGVITLITSQIKKIKKDQK